MSYDGFKKIVEGRRSIRKFTDEKVPEALVSEWFDLTLLAPNSSNLQPWEFYRITSADKKILAAEYCFNQNAAKTASELIAVVARPDLWKRGQKLNLDEIKKNPNPPKMLVDYYTKIVPLAYSADPFGVLKILKTLIGFITGLAKPSYRGPFGKSGNLLWATKTTSLAAENLMLAIRASGFDSCPMEGFDQVRMKKLLGLPGGAYVVMMIGAGRAAPDGLWGPRTRGPKEMFVKQI